VTNTVSEISSAASEQANGIDEMSQAVAHMDEMTQQNAALAEESAASAGALAGQIERLNEIVATFKTGQGAALRPSYEPATRPASKVRAPAKPAPQREPAARPTQVAAQVRRPAAPSAAPARAATAGEPERLRRMAQEAFAMEGASHQGAAKSAARPAPPRKVAGGWDEF
jgi:methyl-accepting chemotaxis protein